MRAQTAAAAAATAALLAGCGTEDVGLEGPSGPEEAGEVTLESDQSSATVPPLCVEDIPEDLTACAGAPGNLGMLELDETRKATLVVPTEVAAGGYRVRINGQAPADLQGVLEDRPLVIRISPEAVQAPGETVLTVEALFSPQHPRAVWQFLLSDPAAAPD